MEGASTNSAGKANGSPACKSTASLGCVMKPWAWFHPEQLDPRVADLVYWRDLKRSGVAFSSAVVLLLSLSFFSLISVVAYSSLLVLSGAVAFRIYKNVCQAVQKTQDGHPFKECLAADLSLPSDKVHAAVDCFLAQINCCVSYLQKIFLVEDLIDSCKFACAVYALTYVGSWFNGLTLLLLAVLAAFSLPKAYEQHQPLVDQYLGIACAEATKLMDKVKAVVPMGGAKKQE